MLGGKALGGAFLLLAMLLRSCPHSMNCSRRALPDTTVIGPLTSFRL